MCVSKTHTKPNYNAHNRKAELKRTSPLSDFSIDLYDRIATSTLISKSESVSIMLKNGQVIGKDEQNANGN